MSYKVDEERSRNYVSSGILIDKDVLLTAGHCLYIQEYGPPFEIKFYPGRHGNIAEKVLGFSKFFVPKEWQRDQDEDHDLGLIVLEGEYETESYGKLEVLSDDERLDLCVRVSGYPADKRDNENLPYMYTLHGPIATVKRNKI